MTAPRPFPPKPIFVRVAHAQEMFGVHRATIYRWAEAGKVTIHKVGSVSLLNVAEMEAMITGGKSA